MVPGVSQQAIDSTIVDEHVQKSIGYIILIILKLFDTAVSMLILVITPEEHKTNIKLRPEKRP